MQTILALAAGSLHPEVFTFHTGFYTSAHTEPAWPSRAASSMREPTPSLV